MVVPLLIVYCTVRREAASVQYMNYTTFRRRIQQKFWQNTHFKREVKKPEDFSAVLPEIKKIFPMNLKCWNFFRRPSVSRVYRPAAGPAPVRGETLKKEN